jgi:hypothetical protein
VVLPAPAVDVDRLVHNHKDCLDRFCFHTAVVAGAVVAGAVVAAAAGAAAPTAVAAPSAVPAAPEAEALVEALVAYLVSTAPPPFPCTAALAASDCFPVVRVHAVDFHVEHHLRVFHIHVRIYEIDHPFFMYFNLLLYSVIFLQS